MKRDKEPPEPGGMGSARPGANSGWKPQEETPAASLLIGGMGSAKPRANRHKPAPTTGKLVADEAKEESE